MKNKPGSVLDAVTRSEIRFGIRETDKAIVINDDLGYEVWDRERPLATYLSMPEAIDALKQ